MAEASSAAAGSESRTSRTTPTPAELLMLAETRIRYGLTPHSLGEEPLGEANWQIVEDQFLLRGMGEHYFHYRKGRGLTVERGPGADLSEEALWLNGSVYSAIAALNGLLPIHASAVAHDGRVFAFSGGAGAGKSTLVAALGDLGIPLFCDDTLVLDLTGETIICLPGHKRLKLSPSALRLTGATAAEKVSRSVDKYYAEPAAGEIASALPLAELVFLEDGDSFDLAPVRGSERLLRLHDDHQTTRLFASAQLFDRKTFFEHLARLASQIEMARFVRPRDPARFREGVAIAAKHVTGGTTSFTD